MSKKVCSSKEEHNRNALKVMLGLVGLVRPLLGIMCIAILMGCIGNLMAIFITVLGGAGIGVVLGFPSGLSLRAIFILLVLFALLRGVLRYGEQASNHYIAFKLLARIRHQVFAALRRLAPAKLEGREKGNLISIITSDIELLEVFYAHTISPIAIAILTSLVMVLFIGSFHPGLGLLAALFYILVGAVIPVVNGRAGLKHGQNYRNIYGRLNTTVLDNLYGLEEILQYENQTQRQEKMDGFTEQLEQVNGILKSQEAKQRISTDTVILLAGVVMALGGGILSVRGMLSPGEVILSVIAMMSSFGPAAALSALSNNLNQTLASGNRVLNLLEEEAPVLDIVSRTGVPKGDISLDRVSFAYPGAEGDKQETLTDVSLIIKENTIHGILGKSGCGKSTLLKLLMRFYETKEGQVLYGDKNVNEIDTGRLRSCISYVTQETFLFQDTIENNIKLGRPQASPQEVEEAAKKASIHEFIMSLPKGYDTVLGELGDTVSGGERQRLGIARAFLHDAGVILLDEPTSNIDSLNEGMILKSLLEAKKDKTIVLVSHRRSTMAIADHVTGFEPGACKEKEAGNDLIIDIC